MVESYNRQRDVLLLHLPNRIKCDSDSVIKCCFTYFPSFFSLHVDNYGNVSQFHAGKTFLLHNFYVPAHTSFMCRESATSCDFHIRRQEDVFVQRPENR